MMYKMAISTLISEKISYQNNRVSNRKLDFVTG